MHNLLSSIKWILVILAILLFFFLGIANMGNSIVLVVIPGVWEFPSFPLSLALILGFVFSFMTLFVVGLLDQVTHYFTERELRRKIRDLENEVSQLRNLPIRENLKSQQAVEQENRS